MTRDEQASEPHDLLRLDRCPDCGYLLTGLPPDGRCPECGFAYTQDMIAVYVWPSGTGPGWRGWWWLLALPLCLEVPQMSMSIWTDPRGFFLPRDFGGVLTLITFLLALIAFIVPTFILFGRLWLWHLGRRHNPPAPLQVRMTPQGYAVRYGFGRAKLKPWTSGHQLWLRAIPGGRYSLAIQDGGVHTWEFAGDCQLDCDVRTADRIRQRVQTWCDQPASWRPQTESRPADDPPGGSRMS